MIYKIFRIRRSKCIEYLNSHKTACLCCIKKFGPGGAASRVDCYFIAFLKAGILPKKNKSFNFLCKFAISKGCRLVVAERRHIPALFNRLFETENKIV